MTPMPSATASLTELLPAPGPGTPLLSYPLATSEACVLTSDPATWAQRTAWDIREHNLGRFLDARHGAKIEDYWTPEFIKYRGRTYCELVLKYIIMFNHEEVGGHAVMFIDQMMMWQPHYFPYAMKYRCYVDAIFEKDQIEHYGRKFLEKVVEWCKIAYEKSQLYWDHLLADPPTDEYFEVFVTLVRKQHTPQKLKAMNIVPKEREDDWPCNYFARARGKTPLPQLQMQKEAAKQHCNLGSPGNNSGKTNASTQPKDTNGGSRGDAKSSPHGATPTASSTGNQVTSGAGKGKQASVALLAAGGGGGDDDSDDSDSEDKKCDPRDSTPPKSPKGKKSVSSEAEDNSLRVHDSVVHRRVKSESDSQGKPFACFFPHLRLAVEIMHLTQTNSKGK